MKKCFAHIVSFVVWSINCYAQDMHFSQFNENPSLVNPALTGVSNPFRASVNYKDQWRSVTTPYKTFGVSFDSRLNNSSWQQVDKFRTMTFKERSMGRIAWGLSVYGDKAGTGKLGSTESSFLLATFVPISRKSFISVGTRTSFIQRSLDNSRLVFPSQYNGKSYDPNLPQNERFSDVNYNYLDFAFGALWSYGQGDRRIITNAELRAKAGFACYHISGNHSGFYYYQQRSNTKYVFHGDLLYSPMNFNIAVVPSFMMQMQGNSVEAIMGSMLKYYLNFNSKYTGNIKRSSIGYGLYYRNRDAVIFTIAVEKDEQYVISLSYDLNTSKLVSASTGRGGLELALRYTPPKAFLYQKKVEPEK
jgi:type IX secretion system PorP/SprF family membrane protein